jgi:hypothetical protein
VCVWVGVGVAVGVAVGVCGWRRVGLGLLFICGLCTCFTFIVSWKSLPVQGLLLITVLTKHFLTSPYPVRKSTTHVDLYTKQEH